MTYCCNDGKISNTVDFWLLTDFMLLVTMI